MQSIYKTGIPVYLSYIVLVMVQKLFSQAMYKNVINNLNINGLKLKNNIILSGNLLKINMFLSLKNYHVNI